MFPIFRRSHKNVETAKWWRIHRNIPERISKAKHKMKLICIESWSVKTVFGRKLFYRNETAKKLSFTMVFEKNIFPRSYRLNSDLPKILPPTVEWTVHHDGDGCQTIFGTIFVENRFYLRRQYVQTWELWKKQLPILSCAYSHSYVAFQNTS